MVCKTKTYLLHETSFAPLLVTALCAIPHLGLSVTPQAAVTSFVALCSFGLFPAAALGRLHLSEFLFVSAAFFLTLPTTLAVCRADIYRGVRKMKAKARARELRESVHTKKGRRGSLGNLSQQRGSRKGGFRVMTNLLKSKGQDDATDMFDHFQREDPRYAALLPWAVNLESVERMEKPVRSLVPHHNVQCE